MKFKEKQDSCKLEFYNYVNLIFSERWRHLDSSTFSRLLSSWLSCLKRRGKLGARGAVVNGLRPGGVGVTARDRRAVGVTRGGRGHVRRPLAREGPAQGSVAEARLPGVSGTARNYFSGEH